MYLLRHCINFSCFLGSRLVSLSIIVYTSFIMLCILHRSVVNILSEHGDLLNTYQMDPFGEMMSSNVAVESMFTFIGQWGVIDIPEIEGVFYMRTRWYDAATGRFMSVDRFGLKAHSKNFYAYCANNPVHFNDPRGTCPICIKIGIDAVGGVIDYGISTPFNEWTWGGNRLFYYLFKLLVDQTRFLSYMFQNQSAKYMSKRTKNK